VDGYMMQRGEFSATLSKTTASRKAKRSPLK